MAFTVCIPFFQRRAWNNYQHPFFFDSEVSLSVKLASQWFSGAALVCSVDCIKTRATFSTKRLTRKPTATRSNVFPRAWRPLHIIASNFSWLIQLYAWSEWLLSFDNRSIIIIVFHNYSALTCLTDDRSAGLKCSAMVVTCSILAASLRLFLAGGWDGCSAWVCWYVSLPSAN